jgi:N-acetylglucosamine-6-phosphate deacetylase
MASLGRIAIQAGQILTPLRSLSPGVILIEGETIVAVGRPEEVPLPDETSVSYFPDNILVPGLIDTHTHGRDGHYFGEEQDATRRLCQTTVRSGVTALLPTLASLMPMHYTLEMMLQRIDNVRQVMAQGTSGAQILGIHLEGPFLSKADTARGSQLVANLRSPSVDELRQMEAASEGIVRKMSIAPELEGAIDVIREMVKLNIVPCAGHSTATYEQAIESVEAGLCCATHVFNGMLPFHHRRPGLLGAVLLSSEINAELIADGQHVSAAAMKLLVRCKGIDRVHLITDNTIWAGMPNGTYEDLDRTIVKEEDRAYVVGGTLVGSVAPLNHCVANMVHLAGCSLQEAVTMATLNPATIIGAQDRKGSLAPGKDADLVVIDKEFEVYMTMVKGQEVCGPTPLQC